MNPAVTDLLASQRTVKMATSMTDYHTDRRCRDAVPLSCDGFIVVLEMYYLGGEATRAELMRRVIPRISTPFTKALDNAISNGQIAALSSGKAELQSSTTQKTYKLLNEELRKALVKLYQAKPAGLSSTVRRATDRRTFSAPYHAVVTGKKARRDKVQQFISRQNPQDRPAMWRSYGSLDDAAREAIAQRITRLPD